VLSFSDLYSLNFLPCNKHTLFSVLFSGPPPTTGRKAESRKAMKKKKPKLAHSNSSSRRPSSSSHQSRRIHCSSVPDSYRATRSNSPPVRRRSDSSGHSEMASHSNSPVSHHLDLRDRSRQRSVSSDGNVPLRRSRSISADKRARARLPWDTIAGWNL